MRSEKKSPSYSLVVKLKNEEFPISLILSKVLKALKKSLNELEYSINEEKNVLNIHNLSFKDVKKILDTLKDFEEDLDIDLIPQSESESYELETSFYDELKEIARSILKVQFLKEPIFWAFVIAIIPNFIYTFVAKDNIEILILMQNVSLAILWIIIVSIFLEFTFDFGIFLILILSLIFIYFSIDFVGKLNTLFATSTKIQAGFIEEAYKLAIVFIFLKMFTEKARWKVRNYMLRFSVLIGFMVGISFGIIENIHYFSKSYLAGFIKGLYSIKSPEIATLFGFLTGLFTHLGRLFLTTLLHALLTSISSFITVFGLFRPFTRNYLLTGYFISATLHALYNYSITSKKDVLSILVIILSAFIFYSILKYTRKISV